ncbi:uncharacterized protein KY384_000678 [Bacidia gigantensis]|uniref:uncharacterized protein n=1 Tax=Bacidia gigantensis TaxID=2732470 RepID=UPI001D05984B|nr:uncharacterized protein KY384_000678 [Bacidia gigantensis]KAG8525916.1 hypothetical protein KY384_000678 [Bacidia gigantensis]
MMEQLAERRMQREEESRMVASGMGHPSMRHGQPEEEDDEYDDEGDDEDFNSEEDEEFEDDELAMSEEQRMEEGRRMFQIFAARMFEQRVLNAYRQKVAEERQRKLIEELDEDKQVTAQREAKKAKESQKKKDKRQKAKQVKDEEKAKREAEKAAEEAAAKAIEDKKAEEQRQKKEEQRRKKEAEKKSAEEDRKRKEEEKQRQARERKEQLAEQERKQREAKEREKKKREEAKRKEREERESREREIAERKELEVKSKAEHDAKERSKRQEAVAAQAASIPKRPSPAAITVPASSSLQPQQRSHTPSSHASPRLPIATPAVPKPPTPSRQKQKSFQGSRTASPRPSQPTSSSTASPAASSEHHVAAHARKASQVGAPHPSSQISRFSPVDPPTVSHPPGFSNVVPTTSTGFSSPFGPPMSPGRQQAPSHPPGFPSQQPYGTGYFQNPSMPFPPGINTMRHVPPGQHSNVTQHAPQIPEPAQRNISITNHGRFSNPQETVPAQAHSRNQSASSGISPRDPNQRPAPIQRPPSTTGTHQNENIRPKSKDVDDLSNHLGSSALLDDADEEAPSAMANLRQGSIAVGGPRPSRQGPFGSNPGFAPIGSNSRIDTNQQMTNSLWGSSQASFGGNVRPNQPFSSAPGFGRPTNGTFLNTTSLPAARPPRIRLLICSACDKLNRLQPSNQGWHAADQVLHEVQSLMSRNEPAVAMMEMLQTCDTEGNAQSGGGVFEYRTIDKGFLIKHKPDASLKGRNGPPPGEIGSPIGSGPTGNGFGPIGGQPTFQQQGGFPSSSGF